MPNLMGLLATPVIRSVRLSATQFRGSCTWEFSQVQDPVGSLIKALPESADGICEMLSAVWIERHAHDDHLSKWLTGGGKSIDPSKIRMLMQLFAIGTGMNASALVGVPQSGVDSDQTRATRLWLEAKGLRRRQNFVSGAGRGHKVDGVQAGGRAGASRGEFAKRMAIEIAGGLRQGTGSYRTIGMWGPGGAHAMAAWVAQDVAFFDPNFGEFWFEKRADFVQWWPVFLDKAFYRNRVLGLSDRYELMDFALKAG